MGPRTVAGMEAGVWGEPWSAMVSLEKGVEGGVKQ